MIFQPHNALKLICHLHHIFSPGELLAECPDFQRKVGNYSRISGSLDLALQ